ncbi:MAG: hypothetical protein VX733_10030 [Candidatus Latescibacterota bacterium]|nr:hypothetical protein [Candidatus Latescibacterota bacterium]
MKLKQTEVDVFRLNGFLRLPTCIPGARVEARAAACLTDIEAQVEPVGRHSLHGRVNRLSNLWNRCVLMRGERITGATTDDDLSNSKHDGKLSSYSAGPSLHAGG